MWASGGGVWDCGAQLCRLLRRVCCDGSLRGITRQACRQNVLVAHGVRVIINLISARPLCRRGYDIAWSAQYAQVSGSIWDCMLLGTLFNFEMTPDHVHQVDMY